MNITARFDEWWRQIGQDYPERKECAEVAFRAGYQRGQVATIADVIERDINSTPSGRKALKKVSIVLK